jgi:hypothetical protein
MQENDTLYIYQNSYNLVARNVIKSAIKGVIMLQETYGKEIKDFSAGHH